MPMWKIYHPKNAFSEQDKREIAEKITALYATFLPKFYVNVFFRPTDAQNCYIGGEPTGDFVRITINHITKSMSPEERKPFLMAFNRILNPYVADKGYRWELHVGETPIELWTVQGLIPPALDSDTGRKWKEENEASAYE
ncbi:TPA: tautomerase family protein [Neisseria bacilliformis]|nr:tautomerase family protein [Neisseria bacilliformis]QMT47877.1 tautomerase family protein [Neisseria bacilliformis]